MKYSKMNFQLIKTAILNLILIFSLTSVYSCKEQKSTATNEPNINEATLTYTQAIDLCIQNKARINLDCLIGSEIPEFTATTTGNETITKSSLLGKPTIINFWFVGCPPCEAEVPGLNKIVETYGEDNVNYIAIGRNTPSTLDKYLTKQPWNFKHICDKNEKLVKGIFRSQWGFPLTYILDKDAKIVKAFSGGTIDKTASDRIIAKISPALDGILK